jgi:flagella basal body P-ring formation protein FlgA
VKPASASLTAVCVLALLCGSISAAEVRMRAQARCSTGIVRLSDVAEIFSADPTQHEMLSVVELGPAPGTGSRRYIRAREVQDALFMRGIHLGEHSLSGSERCEVQGPAVPIAIEPPAKSKFRVDEAARERASQTAVAAILKCLQKQAGSREPWEVKVNLTDDQTTSLVTATRRVTAEGGVHPWIGTQQFTLHVDGGDDFVDFDVQAEVSLPPMVVAAARDLPAGTIVHESDLVLRAVKAYPPGLKPFHRIADVVGHETTWGIPGGTLLGTASVRRPIVIHRGDAVTLYARAAGLQVRTTVRSREDGALGALVAVESLTSREVFYARVTGIQEAEVYAAPAEAAPHAAANDRFYNAAPAGVAVQR